MTVNVEVKSIAFHTFNLCQTQLNLSHNIITSGNNNVKFKVKLDWNNY